MIGEPWMNNRPVPSRTPLQLALDEAQRWGERIKRLDEELFHAEAQFIAARKRVAELQKDR